MANIDFQQAIAKVRARHEAMLDNMSDATALMYFKFFPEWKVGMEYKAGKRVRVGNALYRVIEGHVAEEGKEPGVATEIYKKM